MFFAVGPGASRCDPQDTLVGHAVKALAACLAQDAELTVRARPALERSRPSRRLKSVSSPSNRVRYNV